MKKIWSRISLLVIMVVLTGCGTNSETLESTAQSTTQSTVRNIKLDVPKTIEAKENGIFSITGKTEPKTDVDISYGVNDKIITSDENGNFKYDGYSLSDEDNSYSVYVSVDSNTETEVRKEIIVKRSEESIKKIEDEKTKAEQEAKEKEQANQLSEEDKNNLKQQYLEILRNQMSTTLNVSLSEDGTIYNFKPIDEGEFLLAISQILEGGDSKAWYEIKDSLSNNSRQLSELLGEDIAFTFNFRESDEPILFIVNGIEIYDVINTQLVEKGYK